MPRALGEHHDIAIIGGGQAGLAMSAVLQRRGVQHVVIERRQIGERWRTERWESLRFQFPNWSLELPGYAYDGGQPEAFAHWSEILRIIQGYAAATGAPVREETDVTELRRDDLGFTLCVPGGQIHARQVVVATGPFQRPRIPEVSERIPSSVLQTDPTATDALTTSRTALSSSWAAERPAARSATNCGARVAGCSCPSPAIAVCRGGCLAGTSTGGLTERVAWPRRSTAFPVGSGLPRRW
jgi:glycine/D-amino acid oxidase-like deaminating enzyme